MLVFVIFSKIFETSPLISRGGAAGPERKLPQMRSIRAR